MSDFSIIENWQDELTSWRRHLHANPELGLEEVNTSAFIREKLASFGVDAIHHDPSGTMVVAEVHGRAPGRSIGLRADIDALPIIEESNLPYASTTPGIMHACGHDGHTTMLLGAARYLATSRNFSGTAYLIFQPAEEIGGAKRLVDEGLFDRYPVEQVFGMHNVPNFSRGTFFWRNGPIMAAASFFEITVTGKGAHGAQPHLGVDPVLAASAIVLNVQSIVSRTINPYHSAVVTIGVIQGGMAANVIPESVVLKGTARWFDATTGQSLQSALERIVQSTAETYGARAVMTTRLVAPVTVNDQQAMNMARQAAGAVAGEDQVCYLEEPVMGGEDFGFMLQARQGAYILLGSKRPAADNWNLHHPRYDFNDEVLSLGASYWSALVEQQLAVR
jgi:amidohydrolase